MIKRLVAFDFDATLINSPEPDEGKKIWLQVKGEQYPYLGWWGRPESLDLNVFDIKPFPSVLLQLKKELVIPNTYVIILTSRMEKLRSYVQAVLDKNGIVVDKLDMKRAEGNKGIKILRYVEQFPELKVINVYDDRESDIQSYENIRTQIPEGIEFNIYYANQGKLALTESSRKYNLLEIVIDEIRKINL